MPEILYKYLKYDFRFMFATDFGQAPDRERDVVRALVLTLSAEHLIRVGLNLIHLWIEVLLGQKNVYVSGEGDSRGRNRV